MLREHFVDRTRIPVFHELDGNGDVDVVLRTIGDAIASAPIDVAFVGIGENAHLAFNDPPADFETTEPYLVVSLDEACRRQQVGEGWFPTIADVPSRAISMSVQQILSAREIHVRSFRTSARRRRLRRSSPGPLRRTVPASIRAPTTTPTTLYLDDASASQVDPTCGPPAPVRPVGNR